MEKPYNRLSAKAFFEIESIVYLAHVKMLNAEDSSRRFDFWQMYYCADGTLGLRVDGEELAIEKHCAVLLPPNENERSVIKTTEGGECDFYVISFESESENLGKLAREIIPLYGSEPQLIEELCKIGRKILEPIKENQKKRGLCAKAGAHPAVLQYVKNLLEQFFIKVYCRRESIGAIANEAEKVNKQNYEKAVIERAQRFMRDRLNYTLTIGDIADALGVNATSLRLAYKKETGKSIVASFNDMKAEEARRLIAQTGLNFTQIGSFLGFSSLYSFSRFFKEKEGVTLSEFARSVGKKS